jgi:hypothetical protein
VVILLYSNSGTEREKLVIASQRDMSLPYLMSAVEIDLECEEDSRFPMDWSPMS